MFNFVTLSFDSFMMRKPTDLSFLCIFDNTLAAHLDFKNSRDSVMLKFTFDAVMGVTQSEKA